MQTETDIEILASNCLMNILKLHHGYCVEQI